ncbi:MAG: thioesterase [Candidatus Cloacimonetes bacterium]|nr:thioesterase [Candidatus Cloacimonadota bacterium]
MKISNTAQYTSSYQEMQCVRNYETDHKGNIRLVSILNYLQETASNHAEEIGWGFSRLEEKGLFWVLSRMQIEIIRYPHWREKLTVKTWPSGVEKFYALREFLITDETGEILVKASSAWLIISREGNRIQRPQRVFDEFSEIDNSKALQINLEKMIAESDFDIEAFVTAKYSDLDINNHVNNSRYAEWIMNSYSYDFLSRNSVKSVLINYSGQAKADEDFRITISTDKTKPDEHSIEICNTQENKSILIAKFSWIQTD